MTQMAHTAALVVDGSVDLQEGVIGSHVDDEATTHIHDLVDSGPKYKLSERYIRRDRACSIQFDINLLCSPQPIGGDQTCALDDDRKAENRRLRCSAEENYGRPHSPFVFFPSPSSFS